jgi:hypothetical protein
MFKGQYSINSTFNKTLSPGITIFKSFGKDTTPVTFAVLKKN